MGEADTRVVWGLLVAAAVGLWACDRRGPDDAPEVADLGGELMTLTLRSPAFEPGARIPTRHTDDGANSSPPLTWSGVPERAAELALIVDDPDAPRAEPWVHWIVYRIPASLAGLPEGLPVRESLSDPGGVRQGRNDFRRPGYGGPAPPRGHGIHRYRFRLYALDARLDLPPGATRAELTAAMQGHILAQGELVGTYER